MKKLHLVLALLSVALLTNAQSSGWKIVPGHITTQWADDVNPANTLPDYPRPQLQRSDWQNLNGLWQYAILPVSGNDAIPTAFQGNILVPFAVESALSGVGKTVGKDNILWYQRDIAVPAKRKGKRTLLHFGAVDWRSDIYVNGEKVGRHEGGYDPFTFDITDALKKGSKQQLAVRVWDPTNDGPQPHGKQVVNPEGIWYTPVTGIWQTVWLETVPDTYIVSTKQTPDLDNNILSVNTSIKNLQPGDIINISAWKGNEKVAEKTGADTSVTLSISDPEMWSPSHPFLYDLKLTVMRKGKSVDEVKSYFAMRKISIAPDANGIQKMMLNNKFLFEFGPLDQGWWPDGLYTAPTDAALKFDIEKTKEMGGVINSRFIQEDQVLIGPTPTNIKAGIAFALGFYAGQQGDSFQNITFAQQHRYLVDLRHAQLLDTHLGRGNIIIIRRIRTYHHFFQFAFYLQGYIHCLVLVQGYLLFNRFVAGVGK